LLVLEGSTEEQILSMARSLAYVRPLVAYPNWSFDIDFAKPDITYRMRQQIWNYFRDRKAEVALTIGWHDPLKLCLCLSNDLSRQIFIAGCIDPNEFAFLDKVLEPGMSFLDAGANEGIYTLFAAVRVGNGAVWAFEPSQREMERLERNIQLNGLGNVKTFRMGLADEDGEAELTVAAAEHSGQNTFGEFVYPTVESLRREVVPVRTLDRVVEDQGITSLDVVKVDVEGAEQRLLRGARNALRAFRPIILLEASDAALRKQDGDRKRLCEELTAQDYRIYSFDPGSGLPTARILTPYSDNLVAAPVEKALPDSVFEMVPRLSR
jgi:FkbM family methyltransferase